VISLRPLLYADLAVKTEHDPGVRLKADGTVDADWFCMAIGAKVQQFIYILDLYRAQITFPEQVRAIIREYHRWKVWKIGIESNNYQWALGQQIWEAGLPAVPLPSSSDKVYRATMVTPHIETGRVRFRGVMENGVLVSHPALRRFFEEAADFPFGDRDDAVDAVVGLIQMATSEEIMGQELALVHKPGYGLVTTSGSYAGGIRQHKRDPFDVMVSNY